MLESHYYILRYTDLGASRLEIIDAKMKEMKIDFFAELKFTSVDDERKLCSDI